MSSPERKGQLMNSKLYQSMKYITTYLDKYYLDGVAGLVPGGVGDAVTAFFGLTHVYFAMFKLHSIPLTLAVLNNTLRDVLLGLIPFYVGNVIDFSTVLTRRTWRSSTDSSTTTKPSSRK